MMQSSHNAITPPQANALINIIRRFGKENYRATKAALGIPVDRTLLNLSKREAWLLINHYAQGVK